MKAKFIAIVVALMAVGTSASAQNKVKTLTIGASPFGSIETRIKLKDNNEEYKYNYKSFLGANIGYEAQVGGAVTLSELAYSQASFDKYDLQGTSEWFNPVQQEDIYEVSFTQYIGKTFNAKKALQLPIYIGIGADYLNGGPFHNIDVAVAGRAKLKLYITRGLGVYGGAHFRYGLGTKKASESSSSNKSAYTVYNMAWGVDAGILIGL